MMVKRTNNPRELARRRSEKKLNQVGYTPQTARWLSELLLVLAESSPEYRDRVLRVFSAAVVQKVSWPVAGRRS